MATNNSSISKGDLALIPEAETTTSQSASSVSSKDYSTTNIQVENVDEADITKTDGDYIYSISENNVVITNVVDPSNIKIEAKITSNKDCIPEDMILYKDKLIVIYASIDTRNSYYIKTGKTIVEIYDITHKSNPIVVKQYELNEPYYTSRCIDNQLYVISYGRLQKENDEIVTYYIEDNTKKEIGYDNIKYLKEIKTKNQTLIAVTDLDDAEKDIKISSYLIDISNAYVSQNSIYLLDSRYETQYGNMPIKSIFGLKGIFGLFEYYNDYDYERYTKIFKFDILESGNIDYATKTMVKGETINQYSLDEYNGHLRVAVDCSEGSQIVIFDENLNKVGETEYLAKGEKMYSSRFMGNKAYLVTYKTIDPLFVVDLSDEKNPKVLGELKIPGYSTYLHPYDENHIIGIGMETKETIHRDSTGKVISTSASIVGMKMALFDVTDVSNPKQISSTVIGDSRTTSAILTNPKALLFSKERNLIAIPVNNYKEEFEVSSYNESYSSMINSYKSYNKNRVAEGYFVYDIDLENGFNLKGTITHETNQNSYYYAYSKLLRGMYIEDNLYTVSETEVKVNNLKTLELIDSLKIKEEV